VSRADPGGITPGTVTQVTPPPRCVCRHMEGVHTPKPSNPKVRGACTTADPDRCPCKTYTPQSPATAAGIAPREESQ